MTKPDLRLLRAATWMTSCSRSRRKSMVNSSLGGHRSGPPLPYCRELSGGPSTSEGVASNVKGGIPEPGLWDGRGGAVGKVDAHADPTGDVESVSGFASSDSPQLGSNFIPRQDSEAKVLVERTVPGHSGEGCEREGPHVGFERPTFHSADEGAADTEPLGSGRDADLLNVSIPVDPVSEDVAHRTA
jgi:hypothetical protein